jgi:hypothetical protein
MSQGNVCALWVAGIALMVSAAVACGGGVTFTEPTVMPVASFLPPSPRMLPAGSLPPSYAGTWVGQMTHSECRSSIAGTCRINPTPREVTLQLNQAGLTVTGTMSVAGLGESVLTGYVAEDSAFFSPMTFTSDEGYRLERAGDGLVGMKVHDARQNAAIMQSNKYDLTLAARR